MKLGAKRRQCERDVVERFCIRIEFCAPNVMLMYSDFVPKVGVA